MSQRRLPTEGIVAPGVKVRRKPKPNGRDETSQPASLKGEPAVAIVEKLAPFVKWLERMSCDEVAANPSRVWRLMGETMVLPLLEGLEPQDVKSLLQQFVTMAAVLRKMR